MEVILYERRWIYLIAIHSGLLREKLKVPGRVFALVECAKAVVAQSGQVHPLWRQLPSDVTSHL
tara:strand:- start:61 stop:252 length:192 start_codon:yes stop_codon:yes gene_type:complete